MISSLTPETSADSLALDCILVEVRGTLGYSSEDRLDYFQDNLDCSLAEDMAAFVEKFINWFEDGDSCELFWGLPSFRFRYLVDGCSQLLRRANGFRGECFWLRCLADGISDQSSRR